jgi:histone H3/H4
MDGKARVAVESAVCRTLHAHNFSRSSSQATILLTDLLSRYLTLLSSTCVKYAQHGGRQNLSVRDAFCALDELGISTAELGEYCNSEAAELGRYAINTTRRMEELKDFRGEPYYHAFISQLLISSSSSSYRRAQARHRRCNYIGVCALTGYSVVGRERWGN